MPAVGTVFGLSLPSLKLLSRLFPKYIHKNILFRDNLLIVMLGPTIRDGHFDLVKPTANQPYQLNQENAAISTEESKRKMRKAQIIGLALLAAILFGIWLIFFVII
jgi:hypothetical protein